MKIALAYSASDGLIAKEITKALDDSRWSFEHIQCSKDAKDSGCLADHLSKFSGPVILLVSDALLKQTNCIDGMLGLFTEREDDILPIFLPTKDGKALKLDKIGDIIKYINYWQDKYLSFRSQRRELNLENDESFQVHLDTVRNISKEIGEFLRFFRDSQHPSLSEFQENHYKVFFDFLELPEVWKTFKQSTTEGGQTPAEDPQDEGSDENDILEGELADIPGISLLPDVNDDVKETEESGEPSEEEVLLRKIEAEPRTSSHYYNYAVYCLERNSDFEKAREYFELTLEIDPHHPFAWYQIANIYHQNGKINLALDAYKKAVANNTDVKTEENNLKFGLVQEPVLTDANPYEVALDTLKANIDKLSALIRKKDEENRRLEQERAQAKKEEKPGTGKLALITGATSGIGKATAFAFGQGGFNLILTGRRKERLDTIAESIIDEYKVEVKTLIFDVANAEETKKVLGLLRGKWRNIDVLVNNAGKAKGLSPVHEGKLSHWDEMIDTNIKGLLYVTRMISPWMVKRREGMIINLCSSAGKEVYPNGNVYCATKHAVDALTKGMRLDLHAYNIRVGQVSPGHVEETEFAEVRFDGDKERAKIYEDFQPLKAGDVADAILYMATRPPYVNIQDIVMFGTQQASNLICDKSGR